MPLKWLTMIIYNITTKVHSSIDAEWLTWQREEHIPEAMATGFFTGYKLFRLLEQDDAEGNTYAIQYTAMDEEKYLSYRQYHAAMLREKALKKWNHKTISFHSILELIH